MPPPNLSAVDDLCRLALAARQLGCTVTLSGVSDELRTLLDLAGMADLLLENQPDLELDETDLR